LRRFVLPPIVRTDIRTAASYYDRERKGLGREFVQDVYKTIGRILELPRAYPVVYKNARKAKLDDFRYDVFYYLKQEDVIVFAVMHHRRDPEAWKSRL
jgi:plasmid stabilization system protein ParE